MPKYAITFLWDNGCDGQKSKTWIHESPLELGKDLAIDVLKEDGWFSKPKAQKELRGWIDSGVDGTGEECYLTVDKNRLVLTFEMERDEYYSLELYIEPVAPEFVENDPKKYVGKDVVCNIGDHEVTGRITDIDLASGEVTIERRVYWQEIRNLSILRRGND